MAQFLPRDKFSSKTTKKTKQYYIEPKQNKTRKYLKPNQICVEMHTKFSLVFRYFLVLFWFDARDFQANTRAHKNEFYGQN